MVKENEVRINNYYNGGIELVGSLRAKLNANEHNDFQLTRGHFEALCGYTDWLKFINPIPLTTEWLERFLFEKCDNCYVNQIAIYGENEFSYNASYFEHDNLIEIQYVHQLQNLYFTLTGEELTITIK